MRDPAPSCTLPAPAGGANGVVVHETENHSQFVGGLPDHIRMHVLFKLLGNILFIVVRKNADVLVSWVMYKARAHVIRMNLGQDAKCLRFNRCRYRF